MTLSAAQGILLGVGLATALLIAAGTWVLGVVFFAVFDGGEDDVADVQRFVALTEEARGLVPPGLPLFDADKAAATTEAIERFRAKKDEARLALWASRPPPRRHASKLGSSRASRVPGTQTAAPHPRPSTTRTPDPGAASE